MTAHVLRPRDAATPAARTRRPHRTLAVLLAVPAAGLALLAGPAPAARALVGSPVLTGSPAAATPAAPTLAAPVLAAGSAPSTVTFGIRPSGPKKLDARTTWTYQNVKPGAAFADYLAVVNRSNGPVTVRLYAADGLNTATGGFDVALRTAKQEDVGAWVAVRKPVVTVPGGRTLILPFVVRVPATAEPGDHAGGIVASVTSKAKDAKGNLVDIENRVGSRIYLRVAGDLKAKLGIESMAATWSGGQASRGTAQVRFTVRNTGNVRLEGTQSVRLSSPFGASVDVRDVPDLPELLPGNSFTFTTTTDRLVPLAFYTADVVVDPRSVSGNVDPALEQARASKRFLAAVWPTLALVFLLTAGVTFVVLRRRRSRRDQDGPGASAGPAGGADGGSSDGSGGPDAGDAPTGSRPSPQPAGSTLRTALRTALRPAPGATAGRRGRTRAAVTATVAGALVALGPLLAGPAAAGAGDGLFFVPFKGADIDPMYVVTEGPCPRPTVAVVGVLTGPGIAKQGIVVVPNTSADVRTDDAFGVPMQDTLAGFAAAERFTLDGAFRVELKCIDELGTKTYKTFRGEILFREGKRFTAPKPVVPPQHGVPMAVLEESFPDMAVPGPSAAPGQGEQPAVTAAPSGAAVASRSATTDAAEPASLPWGVIGAVLAVVLLVVVPVAVRNSRPSAAAPAEVEWPDDDGDDDDGDDDADEGVGRRASRAGQEVPGR